MEEYKSYILVLAIPDMVMLQFSILK